MPDSIGGDFRSRMLAETHMSAGLRVVEAELNFE